MKKLCLPLLCALVLTGCANQYVIVLNNGAHLTTPTKPKKVENDYVYTDVNGNKVAISCGRVRTIETASDAEADQKELTQFKASKTATKHWYQFW